MAIGKPYRQLSLDNGHFVKHLFPVPLEGNRRKRGSCDGESRLPQRLSGVHDYRESGMKSHPSLRETGGMVDGCSLIAN
ncbi:hypothetical protein CEXT_582201 [Caerostris extrusa]|uniref:Uncharacterized protein n=1 Tax=Caerostris extrusa TaxID=172846 RepID=A0AAV4ME16_CAEEX|nr:hypothetical protein CEXT_582201 [Caerostris extrusa]